MNHFVGEVDPTEASPRQWRNAGARTLPGSMSIRSKPDSARNVGKLGIWMESQRRGGTPINFHSKNKTIFGVQKDKRVYRETRKVKIRGRAGKPHLVTASLDL